MSMKNFKSWKEYIDERGKLVDKPPVKTVPDFDGKIQTAPEKSIKSGKGWKIDGPKPEQPKPYSVKNTQNAPAPEKGGFAEKGDKDLIYKPKLEKKLKSEEFIEKTQNMSLQEYANYIVEQCKCESMDDDDMPTVTAYAAGRFHPHPPEAVKYVAHLSGKNDRIKDALIHEFKRNGGLKGLVEALMDHPETYDILVDILEHDEHGPKKSDAFVSAMSSKHTDFMNQFESVGPSVGLDDEFSDEEIPDEPSDNDEMPDDETEDTPNDDEIPPEDSEVAQNSDIFSKPKKKPKKKFSHDNLLDSMSKHDHMLDKMRSY